MKIVRLPHYTAFFDVLEEKKWYTVLRNRQTGHEFVVTARDFRQFQTVTHPSVTMER